MSRTFDLFAQVSEILDRAEAEGRELTVGEKKEYDSLLARTKRAAAHEKALRELSGVGSGQDYSVSQGDYAGGGAASPGEAFVNSRGYKSIRASEARGDNWTTGPVDVGLSMKGTLGETTGGAGPGGGLTPAGYVPGIVSTLFQPLGLVDYFGAPSDSVVRVIAVVRS
jgi:hypothetical protein